MGRLTSPTQPFCRWCGKPLRKFTRTVWIEKADSGRTEAGRAASDWSRYVFTDTPPTTKAECQALTNLRVISVHYTALYQDGEQVGRALRSFGEWDGESYLTVYDYFCSNPCAAELGRTVVRDRGLCGADYNKALREGGSHGPQA
jgi:hypothetical protein